MSFSKQRQMHRRASSSFQRSTLLVASCILLSFRGLSQQTGAASDPLVALTPAVEEQLLQHLPDDWSRISRRYHIFTDSDVDLLKSPSKDVDLTIRTEAMRRLLDEVGAEDFVVAHMDEFIDRSLQSVAANRERAAKFLGEMLYSVAYSANWLNSPLAVPFLEHVAASEPDPVISLDAIKALHVLEAERARVIVERRLFNLSADDYQKKKDEIDRLEAEDQRLLYVRDQIDLPEFMRDAPPLFQVPAKSDPIRVVMMGDFGTRGENQHKVATAMLQEHQKKPFDFGITLGDNFYVDLASTEDANFKLAFEDLYGPLGITFYPCFGNHDWGGQYPAIELLYSKKNPHWNFPAPYYTYIAGPVQFFVLNSEFDGAWPSVSSLQLRWLRTQLDESKATWKVVYSHMPIYTSTYAVPDMISGLLPVLKGRADIYICGHVHNLQHHKPVDGVHFFIIGSSGRGQVRVNAADPETIFAREAYGFGVLEVGTHDLTIRILGEDDKEMHSATFHK